MSPTDLLLRLRELDVRIRIEDGQLRFSPDDALPRELRDDLRAHEAELIRFLREVSPASAARRAPGIAPVPRDRTLPVSFAQQRFWFLSQLGEENAAYHLMLALRLRGDLDVAALAWALAEIRRRHEALRTTFRVVDGQPVQAIDAGTELAIAHADVTAESDPEAAARAFAQREFERPFDLTAGPLFRVALLRVGPREHWLLATTHHAIADRWSYNVLCDELAALYAARRRGRPSPLATPRVCYADFAAWQLGWYEQRAGDLVAYWRAQLAGAPALELPTDRPRPVQQTFRGGKAALALPRELGDALKALARAENCTFFMALLAAFDVLLARWSGQDDIVVGTPVANRHELETETMIGPFLNSLVLRTDLSGDPSFRALLARVREVALGADQHQQMPFEQLVIELAPQRDLSRNPLFQVMFNVLTAAPALPLDGIEVEPIALETAAANVDLSLVVDEQPDGAIAAVFLHNRDLFDAATIERMAEQFRLLLDGVVRDPDRCVWDHAVLAAHERQVLLGAAARTLRDDGGEGCFTELFAARAAVAPERIAVRCGDVALSYRELDRRANRLARHLRDRGARPGALVGLAVERSAEMLTALLAIAKSGAAWLPLDPSHPRDRLAFILQDAGAVLLVTEQGVRAALPEDLPELVVLDAEGAAIAAQSDAELAPAARSDDLAYVIYTSGSTGRPKGVEVENGALANLLRSMAQQPGFGARDVMLAVTTIAFDIAGLELLLPLVAGGEVVIAPRDVAADGRRLAALLASSGATVMQATPATWRLLLESGWQDSARLTALCGGEALPRDLADQLLRRCGAVWNMYGPTETTIWSLLHRVAAGPGPVPIGAPIAHTDAYVLDRRGQLCPIGVPGELCLGGAGLARGYRARPELTAEKFVPHPFCDAPGARLYATGDVARARADGAFEFLGRRDQQVKVRGFRIELGEIEHALAAHPSVVQCAVVVQRDPSGEALLAAHAVLAPDAAATPAELRAALRDRLPDYMVPATIAIRGALPLTPSGKIDRRALGAGSTARASLQEYVAPRSATERLIAEIWRGVLGVERAGLRDNFFELGGHSLVAMRAVFRLEQATGARFAPMELLTGDLEQLARDCDQRRAAAPAETPELEPAPQQGSLQPSFAQERFWLLAQIETDAAAYNVPFALRLVGPLDGAALQWSLGEVVRRHDALRATFLPRDGALMLQLAAPAAVELRTADIAGSADPQGEAQRRVQRDVSTPFDLACGPLYRFLLLRCAPREHVLAITLHHTVADEWSLGILCHELQLLYAARVEHRPSPLAEPTVRYADYAGAQRRGYAATAARHLAYWRERLDALPALELPTDRPRPPAQTFRGRTSAFSVPAELAARLQELGKREGCTTFMTMLAAFDVLLARYAGQNDVVVGTPIANRSAATERTVGLFLNTVVLRTDLSGEPSFRALLARVRDVALGAFAHAEMPFEQLVAELQPERDLSRSPLFQVLFQANEPPQMLRLGEVRAEPFELPGATAKFDLSFGFADTGSGLAGSFEYNSDLFDDATIARMQRHFVRLLAAIAADPNRPVQRLPLLGDDERRALLVDRNRSARAYPTERCFFELFAARAALTPDAVAVAYGDEVLSYGEIDARANRLAHYLRSRGVGPERLVGISVERSTAMLVALLGIAKSGAAYVPLDPAHPAERLAFIARDAGIELLVTQASVRAALPPELPRVQLDTDAGAIAAQSAAAPPRLGTPDSLAYVIYTSGSTGQPKGVQVEHRALVNFLSSMLSEPGIAAHDVLVAVTTISFDISGLELFLPLLAGGRVVIAPRGVEADGAALAALLARSGATALQATPATWRLLLESGWPGNPRLAALCGGEALPRELAQRLLPLCGQLWNMYGPTETTIWSALHRVASGTGPVPIGAPIANTELFVLDQYGELVPPGVAGELCIGGDGLARGYRGRAAQTAERFVPHPFATSPGARLYATGDRARVRADGGLEFLGRNDDQVKVRGFRIELGEIEHVLAGHPAIAACAVVVQQRAGGALLAAHVVLRAGHAATAAELRDALRHKLPDYMVPAAFAVHAELPRTPSGKIDRRALRRSDAARGMAAVEHEPPRGELEQAVADVWCQVLDVERAGRRDSFFALGGHSLLALRVVGRIKQRLRVEVSVRAVLEFPVLADFAASLRALAGAPPSAAIARTARNGPLPLSFAQERFWFLAQLEGDAAAYNIQAALRLRGPLDVAALTWSLGEIVRRHEVLRTRFEIVGGGPQQVVLQTPFELAVTDLSAGEDPDAEVAVLLAAEQRTPFDLAAGPPVSWRLLRRSPQEHVLALNAHHMAWDRWSLGVLCDELGALYAARRGGAPAWLPELPLQYADFAAWQRHWYETRSAGALAYWKDRLRDLPTIDLPADHARPPVQTFHGAVEPFAVAESVAVRLEQLGREARCTFFMTLLAAFKTLLARYTQQQDLVVGVPAGKRDVAELAPLIGPFLNTLVLRTDLSGEPSFRELLERVREVALGAFEHHDMPFERLVAELRPPRDRSRNPLYQVLFNLLDEVKPPSLADLQVDFVGAPNVTALLDLSLWLGRSASGIAGHFEYNTDLFERPTVARMARHFERLLEEIAADPDRCIWEMPLLSDEECRTLLADANRTARDYPRERCFHELFEARAAEAPDRPAVACGDRALAYGELNRQANRLARHLRSVGAGPGVRVGLCVERSAEMLVALLAVQKTGAAYVPLDPTHPRDRLAFVIEDAAVEVLVVQETTRAALPPELPAQRVVRLDADAAAIAKHEPADLGRMAEPRDVAYVIFTSGSTGRPKGVQLEHRALVNFLAGMALEPGMTRDDVLVAVTTISFDIAALEIYLPLLVGGKVVIAAKGIEADGAALAALLAESRATVVQATPATWHLLLAAGWRGDPGLTILCGGEALSRELAEQLLARCGRLWNMYGPTETTVWSLVHRVASGAGPVPIGHPIANTEVLLLGRRSQPVPHGVTGRLHLGGDGLARGYWKRAALTAEKFTPHPFAAQPGARLYDTGDLARRRADGGLEFVGRADDQVKVRGYRIELGEIEAVLQSSPMVEQAAVTVRRLDDGDARLVAHVVLRPETADREARRGEGREKVAAWRRVWDDTYGDTAALGAGELALHGWNSSYTGAPIPTAEMRAWREHTVQRITALRPERLLEIGCGTGLLLHAIAPACARYVGTDLSPRALARVRRQASDSGLRNVELLERAADDFSGLDPGSFDTVVLNSVVQYFPDVQYLVEVLERAVGLLRAGGRVFVGDVRSLPLLEAFHASVQLHRASAAVPRSVLRQRVRQHVAGDAELVLDPAFFAALQQRLPAIRHAAIRLKPGGERNELTCFRYDVVLHVGEDVVERVPERWIDWEPRSSWLADLGRQLRERAPQTAGVRGVANARVDADLAAQRWLGGSGSPELAGEFRKAQADAPRAAIDPDELAALGAELGYRVDACWSPHGGAGSFDAVFWQPPAERDAAAVAGFAHQRSAARPWHAYANDPLRSELEQAMLPQLRELMRAKLPSYMVPAELDVLDAMPLTPSGKVDRKALAAAEPARADVTALEQALLAHAAVKECAAVCESDAEARLVAHVVLHRNATATVSELRGFLRDKLPDEMIPRTIVMRDELPRTPRGNVDLAALRPGEATNGTEDPALVPTTRMEKFVAQVWREVLRVDRVGLRDNFFDLGGHSLLATRVALRVEKEIGQKVFPMDLLVQDLGQFARHCEKRMTKSSDPGAKDNARGTLLARIRSLFARGAKTQ